METVDAYHPLYSGGGSYGGTSIGKEQEEKATVEEPVELMITKFKLMPNFDDGSDKKGSLSHSINRDWYRLSGPDLWTEDKEFPGFDDEDEFNKGYSPDYEGFPYIERVDLKSVSERRPYININQLLKLGIQEYNKKNGTNYMVVHINKANKQMWGCGFNFYVTFQASAPIVDDDHDAPTATFQALLWEGFFGKTEVRFCRPKKPPAAAHYT